MNEDRFLSGCSCLLAIRLWDSSARSSNLSVHCQWSFCSIVLALLEPHFAKQLRLPEVELGYRKPNVDKCAFSTRSAQLDLHIKKIVDQLRPKVREYLGRALGAQRMLSVAHSSEKTINIIVLKHRLLSRTVFPPKKKHGQHAHNRKFPILFRV